MSVAEALNIIPVFALVFFRLAGMMLFAPLFGSARVPRQMKIMVALVMAMLMTGELRGRHVELPQSMWELAIGIGGELMFGLAMGTIVSFVFIAAQWAGEIIGQQMGFNISEVLVIYISC
jgi:flagellar biosynthetic protein FliR